MQVYLLEDNPYDAAFFCSCMEERAHHVAHFERALNMIDALQREKPGLVVLDVNMPDMSGNAVLHRVRTLYGSALPVVMLSGESTASAVVTSLAAGADDYLIKPMTRPVLVARIEALLRRCGVEIAKKPRTTLTADPYKLCCVDRVLTINDRAVELTPKQFDLAWILFERMGRFIPRSEIVASVWGKHAELAPHTVTQHIYMLRQKLQLRTHGYKLSAAYGAGYRFDAPLASQAAEAVIDDSSLQ
jgi:DNA-binding response OmpR family regulator